MSDSDSALSFERQRRDLFVISALLIVAQLAHFSLGEKISLLGANIAVGNPDVLVYSLWVLWAYWFVRYIQFFLRENALNKIKDVLFGRITLPLAKRAAILFQRNHSINVFQPIDEIWSNDLAHKEDGLEVGKPIRLFEGIRIMLRKNNVSYKYFVPLDEYIGCVIIKLPHFIFIDTEFTDYIFPFLFAIAPMIILISL